MKKKNFHFLNKLDDDNEISNEPKISVVREIYPELWQENIRKALLQIEKEELKRIVLSRKNLILLKLCEVFYKYIDKMKIIAGIL